jgi:translation initiation factor 3 subunit A
VSLWVLTPTSQAEILQIHLYQTKQPTQQQPITNQTPESLQLHLETRFFQLDVAIELELWQEAYKSVESIHNIMAVSKKPPKPQVMANYYQKLVHLFWISQNYLFHAYALYKFYSLTKANNKFATPEEGKLYALALFATTCQLS